MQTLGSAVSRLLYCIDSNLVMRLLGFETTKNFEICCIHSEGQFKTSPHKNDKPHINRVDNMNNVLRAFGMDAHATRACKYNRYARGLFDMRLKDYIMIAAGADLKDGIPCFHLDPKKWSKHLADANRKCLVDETLKNALAAGMPEAGITQWQDRGPDVVFNVLEHYGYHNKNTLVLRLSPEGILLSSEKLCRRQPHDIFKHSHEQSSSNSAVGHKRVSNSHHQVKQSDPKSTMLCLEYSKSPSASEKFSERNLTHTSKRMLHWNNKFFHALTSDVFAIATSMRSK